MGEKKVLLQKAGTPLNDEDVKKAIKEYDDFINDNDSIANNFHLRVYDILKYLIERKG